MKKNDHSYFANRECQYYPCHANADPEHFNCLFCYCPLYGLGKTCGGNFLYTKSGVKDCSNCVVPHSENGYEHVVNMLATVNETSKFQKI